MQTNLDQLFKSNDKNELDGVEFKFNENISFFVRRFGGANEQRVKQAMAKYYQPFARQINAGLMDAKKEKEILIKAFVMACMVGWKGLIIDGVEAPYSVELAEKLFIARPELFDTVYSYASNLSSFKDDVGNF